MKQIKKSIVLGIILLTPHAVSAIVELEDDAIRNLIIAAYANDNTEVQKLITHENADVDGINHGVTALYSAAEQGSTDAAEVLISNDANVNFQNRKNGMTPLMIAAKKGHDLMVKMLLDTGKVNTSLVDKAGHDALFYAKQNGNEDIIGMISDASQ